MIRRMSAVMVAVFSIYMLAGCDFPQLPDRRKAPGGIKPLQKEISFSVPGAVDPEESINLEDHKGQAVLLDFRATWSDACDADIPLFNKMAADYREQGLVVIGMIMDNPVDAKVSEYLKGRGVVYPCGAAATVLEQSPFSTLRVIPSRYILNRDHCLSGEPITGETDEYVLRKRIEEIL